MIQRSFIIFYLLFLSGILAFSQDAYKAVSRYDYYTNEASAVIAVWIPESKSDLDVSIDIVFEFDFEFKAEKAIAGQFNLFEIPVGRFHPGNNEVTVSYNENRKWVASDKVNIVLLEDQFNAVKIDRLSGGLIVEGLPFIPFGFYNYSPVQPALAEEEVVKGFNMMSPYQKIEGKTLKERKTYMDRCASLGMKVNYNVLSLAGGGGVGHKNYEKLSHRKRIKMLRKEVETFKDHPALLSWYISDEPVGQGVPPDSLEEAYNLIKEIDPYHPVTVVFMSPQLAADYSHVMDIVMADPYPIPNGKVEEVGSTAAMLNAEFFLEKPVWIVPQAFGGNEWWEREPTQQELRVMTYLGLVNHAMGIQYFIRHGLNSFPKSTIAWNECGAMALEIAELTPYLFSSDPEPEVTCPEAAIQMKAYQKDGAIIVMAVNTKNEPMNYSFTVEGFHHNGTANLIFEDRKIQMIEGRVEDIIDAYGTRVYEVRYKLLIGTKAMVHPKNLIKDASFENTIGTGVPASCYARPQDDKGANYFIDSRIAARGAHSLRMTTPTAGEGMSLSFFRLNASEEKSYTMSIYAKALPLKYRGLAKKSFFQKLCGCGADPEDYPVFTMKLGHCEEYFIPDGDWKEYSFSCVPMTEPGTTFISPGLSLDGKGTAWFDLLQVYPDMDVASSVSRENNDILIGFSTIHTGAGIYYTLDGSTPTMNDKKFTGPFRISETSRVQAAAFKDGKQVGYLATQFTVSLATGRFVDYKQKWSVKYHAAYKDGLVDGILASPDFKDGKWQGFEGEDFDVTIHLKELQAVSHIDLRFLENKASWIFLPEEISVLWSADGNTYAACETEPEHHSLSGIHVYTYPLNEKARYIRIVARNIGTCPASHPGAGGKAWLFTDEIIVR